MIKVLLLVLLLNVVSAFEDIILPPISSKVGEVSVLFFGQGANLSTSQYTQILTDLQNACDFPLWIGIPQCPNNACAVGLKEGMERIERSMKLQGMRAKHTFYAGHSLGVANECICRLIFSPNII